MIFKPLSLLLQIPIFPWLSEKIICDEFFASSTKRDRPDILLSLICIDDPSLEPINSERPIPNLKELSTILGKYFCFCVSLPPSEIAIGAMIYDPTYEIGATPSPRLWAIAAANKRSRPNPP